MIFVQFNFVTFTWHAYVKKDENKSNTNQFLARIYVISRIDEMISKLENYKISKSNDSPVKQMIDQYSK